MKKEEKNFEISELNRRFLLFLRGIVNETLIYLKVQNSEVVAFEIPWPFHKEIYFGEQTPSNNFSQKELELLQEIVWLGFGKLTILVSNRGQFVRIIEGSRSFLTSGGK